MATSLYKAQEALKTCDDHHNEELTCFCKTCKKFICTMCAKTAHMGHDWDLIPVVAKKRRKETPILCRKIKQDRMSRCREKLSVIGDNISTVEKARDDDVKSLEERRTFMINIINEFVDEQKRQREEYTYHESAKMKEQLNELIKKIEYLDKMTSSLDDNITAYSDYDVIEMEQDMLTALEDAESCEVNSAVTAVRFVPGEIDKSGIEKMFGKILDTTTTNTNEVSVEEVKTFKEFDGAVLSSIAQISDTKAWACDSKGHESKLLSLQTNDKETIRKLLSSNFIILRNGDFISSYYDMKNIRRITSTRQNNIIVNTKPLRPMAISKTHTEDFLISLRDDGDHYKLQRSSRRLVQRMTLAGKVLNVYEFQKDGTTRLFTEPYRTAENGNSDICAINRTSAHSGELIVLRSDGQVRMTYNGQNAEFNPRDVACDSKHRIIVSDSTNNSIHHLNPDGTFLRYLFTDMLLRPWTLALYQDNLWIGFHEGTVKVYKYSE